MPRDSAGVYTLPIGNPVIPGTVIASAWANDTMGDIAAQLNNVLTRDGLLGPTGPFKITDGTIAAPGLAWASEPGLGWYRPGASRIGVAAGGQAIASLSASAADITGFGLNPRAAGTSFIDLASVQAGSANASLLRLQTDGTTHYLREIILGTGPSKPLQLGFTTVTNTGSLTNVGFASFQNSMTVQGNITALTGEIVAQAAGIRAQTGFVASTGGLVMGSSGSLELQGGGNIVWSAPSGGLINLAGSNNFPAINLGSGGYQFIFERSNGNLNWQHPGPPVRNAMTIAGAAPYYLNCPGGFRTDAGSSVVVGPTNLTQTALNLQAWADVGGGRLQNTIASTVSGISASINFWHQPGTDAGIQVASGSSQWRFYNDGRAQNAHNNTTWDVVSDTRLKRNIRDCAYGLDEIIALRVRTFDMDDQTRVGLVADEAEKVFPALVMRHPGRLPDDTHVDDLASVNIDPLIYALINSTKTLHERLSHLESQAAGA